MYKTKLFSALALCSLVAISSACSKNEQTAKSDDQDSQKIAGASKEDLEQAVSDRDELLSLVNEISNGLADIKKLENIVATDGSETPSQKAKIRQDIAAIQAALTDRRQRLEEVVGEVGTDGRKVPALGQRLERPRLLEKKLSSSNVYTSKLSKTIESMKLQIENQTKEIASLTQQLSDAKAEIGSLNNQVDSLNNTVADVSGQRDVAQQEATNYNNQLNEVFIAIGNKKELKENRILEKKFLSKTKILTGDFNQKFFSTQDKRTYEGQVLYGAKKAEIKTNQPKDSYTLTKQGNNMVLKVLNKDRFWSNTSYLVIQIN